MARLFPLLFAVLICCQAFYNAGLMGYWLANRAYIASTLCENRDQPELHCEGKCYLKKKLTSAENAPADTQQKFPDLKKGIELAESPALFTFQPVFFTETFSQLIPEGFAFKTPGFPFAVFHPPSPVS